ncbi:MAG: pyruvate formate lyase family protein, partial [Candidatus Omnitrophota bacterium]|nr:pyruvate formate lyase family protein [Candidatus Omnitrophota bacterium]
MSITTGVLKIPATKRIMDLREKLVNTKPSVCGERAVIVTESYKETEGQPIPIRRAKALKKIMEEMTIRIWDDELIVGNHASRRRAAPVFPEWGVYWLERQLDEIETRPQDKMIVTDEVKSALRGIFPYWRGKTVYDRVWGTLPDDVKEARTAFMFTVDLYERGSFGHMIYDIPGVLSRGFRGIKEEALARIAAADASVPEDFSKMIFWKAVVIVSDGIISFAQRYAEEARRLAQMGGISPQRRKELLKIAEVCSWVPENPARNFWEAVQAAWFLQLVIQIEGNGNSVSMGRMDQHLYPYFLADYTENKITLEEAQELLDCLWIKLNEIVKVWDTEATRVHAGFPMTQNVIIGGQTPEGFDATNELTYLFLNTQDHIRLASPQFTMRVHKDTPWELLLRACEVIRGGGGMPALFGDEAVISSLLNLGIPIQEARNYGM